MWPIRLRADGRQSGVKLLRAVNGFQHGPLNRKLHLSYRLAFALFDSITCILERAFYSGLFGEPKPLFLDSHGSSLASFLSSHAMFRPSTFMVRMPSSSFSTSPGSRPIPMF